MPEIVGVRFRSCGKIYDFEAQGLELKPGDLVIVESEMGLSVGSVVRKADRPAEEKELKKVLRMASEEDLRESEANTRLKKEAFDFCKERIMARGLLMKLIRTDATLDRKRIIFYFVSEKRIDFRELVKDLAQKFRTRIEMRQVGVRDEAKFTGGLGICGRPLCCTSFLVEFAPISIKMAKKQELVLNTGKLSGCCGRLMCCLSYEYRDTEEPEEEEIILKDEPEEEETFLSPVEMAPQIKISPETSPETTPRSDQIPDQIPEQIVEEVLAPVRGKPPAPEHGRAEYGRAEHRREQGAQGAQGPPGNVPRETPGGERKKRKKKRWKKRGKDRQKPST